MKTQKGFTLIELLVVISVIAILSVIGIAAFVNYQKQQVLNNAALEFVASLQKAKSRALSQIKTSNCSATPLDGYVISINSVTVYTMSIKCGGTYSIETKTLPLSTSFSSDDTGKIFTFKVITGGVDGASVVTINGDRALRAKTITIYNDGRIISN